MRIYLDIDENQVIRDVKFKTFIAGCRGNQQHGHGAGKGKDSPGGHGCYQ